MVNIKQLCILFLTCHLTYACLDFPGVLEQQVTIGCDASGAAFASAYSRLYVACDDGFVKYFDTSVQNPTVIDISGLSTELINRGYSADIESIEYVSSFPDRIYLGLERDNVIVELDIVSEEIIRVFDLHNNDLIPYIYQGALDTLQSITWVPFSDDESENPSGSFLVTINGLDHFVAVSPEDWLDDNNETLVLTSLDGEIEINNIGRDSYLTGSSFDAENQLFWSTVHLNGVLGIRIHDSNFCFRAVYETSPLSSDKDNEGIAIDNSDPENYKVFIARDDSGIVNVYNWGNITDVPECFAIPELQEFPIVTDDDDDNVIFEDDDEEFSGIVYVPITNQLVGVSDKGKLFTIDANNEYTKVYVSNKPSTISGDFEGITIARPDISVVYIADELNARIWEYDYVSETSHRVFDLASDLPEGAEIEAVVFVPDDQSAPLLSGVFLVALGNGPNIYEFRVEDIYDLNNNNLAAPIIHYGRFCDDYIRGGNYDWYTQRLYWIYHHEDESYIASQNTDMSCFLDRWEHPADAESYGQREGFAFRGNEIFMAVDKDTNGKIFFYDWSTVTQQSTCGTS